MQAVRRIAEEKENSQIVSSKPRTELQRVRLHGLYELLIVLRIILTLNLQTGWIHQDELTNSIEVVAGDYFDLQVYKPDAFNSSYPTHSISLLHTTIYLPYLITNYFLSTIHPVGKEKIPNTKLLLLIPRIFHLLLSFLVDYILIKFCRLNDPTIKDQDHQNLVNDGESKVKVEEESKNIPSDIPTRPRSSRRRRKPGNRDRDLGSSDENVENNDNSSTRFRVQRRKRTRNHQSPPPPPETKPPPQPPLISRSNDSTIRLVTLASSQVILIFAPRSHPSSINLTLFASLLYLVSASFHAYDEYIPLLEKHASLPKSDGVGRVVLLKQMKATGYSSLNRLPWLTILTVIGVWNDPEFFISYASIPLFFYMQRGISHKLVGMKYFHERIFSFLALFGLFSLPFILWDSVYHGKVSWEDFKELNLSPESFVVAPVNYFARKENQFRDWWGYLQIIGLYLVVFNVLGVMGLVSFLKEMYDVVFAEWRYKPNLDSHWTFLNCSLFLPLFFLIQAHGNAFSVFDLTPLIFPLVYMHGHKIPLASRFSSKIGFTWFASNCLGILYFGYVAQGGILTSFMDLADNLTPIRFNDTQVDITFSQMTAIPPTFTLAIPTKWKTILPVLNHNNNDESKSTPQQQETDDDLFSENPFDFSSQTEDFHFNFNHKYHNHHHHDDDDDNLDNNDNGLPSTLYKTVLKLEQSSKVRLYHTGYSPLPMNHLERDLLRLVQKQESGSEQDRIKAKVSFLLIPYIYGRECEDNFKSLKLIHVKTYWNHVFFNLFPHESELHGGGWKNYWKAVFSRNTLHFGLSLYRMEKVGGVTTTTRRNNNNTKIKMETTFQKYFHFHDSFYDFFKTVGNFVTILATSGLFLTSYLVYLT